MREQISQKVDQSPLKKTTWPVARQKKARDDLPASLKMVKKSSEGGHGGALSYDGLVQHPLYERGQIKSRDVRVYESGPHYSSSTQ
jgi:hypothetical protein